MSALSRLRSWWRARRDRAGLDKQLREELEFHVDRCAEDLEREGLSPDAARQRARAALGSMPATGEDVRASLGLRLGDEIRGDLRYALRMLRRSPGFTIVAVLSLGLGIGANTAIFSLIDTVLLKPLPVPRPDRLFFVDSSGGRSGQSGPPYPAFEIMRERNRHFSALAAVSGTGFRVTIDGSTERVRGAHASGQFFDVLQLTASHGRLFTPDDDAQIGAGGRDGAVAVISDALWHRRFGGDLAVLGKTIEVGTRPVTIVGILPPRFNSLLAGYRFDLILPFVLASNDLRERESWWFQAIGRLKDEATVEQAQAELDAFWQAYLDDNRVSAGTRKGFPRIVLTSARRGLSDLRRDFAEPLWIVMAIVAVVLAIGCANVANLLVARASAREHEIALRRAIGAGSGRLLRQMLVEGLLLSALGAALGLGVAAAGVHVLVSLFAGAHQRVLLEPAFDVRLLGFTAAVAVLTGLLFSLMPALHALRRGPSAFGAGGRVSQARPRLRAGQALVALQVTLSIVLLVGAALFVRTLVNLKSVDTGFTAYGVTAIAVDAVLPPALPPDRPERFAAERAGIGHMWQGLADRIGELPGVESAAVAALTPFSGSVRGIRLVVVGPSVQGDSGIRLNQVTTTYFDTFRMRIVKGRPFLPGDRAGSPKVTILNESAARHHFGDADPIGRRVRLPKPGESGEHEVIGIVADVRYESLREPASRMAYVPLAAGIRSHRASDHRGPRGGGHDGAGAGDPRRDPRADSRRARRQRRQRLARSRRGAAAGAARLAAGDRLRRARPRPGVHRPLRRVVLFGRPPHSRDRHPRRRRRSARRRRLAGAARDPRRRCVRGRGRRAGGSMGGALRRASAVRRHEPRSARRRRRDAVAHDGGGDRRADPRQTGEPDRSDPGAPLRVITGQNRQNRPAAMLVCADTPLPENVRTPVSAGPVSVEIPTTVTPWFVTGRVELLNMIVVGARKRKRPAWKSPHHDVWRGVEGRARGVLAERHAGVEPDSPAWRDVVLHATAQDAGHRVGVARIPHRHGVGLVHRGAHRQELIVPRQRGAGHPADRRDQARTDGRIRDDIPVRAQIDEERTARRELMAASGFECGVWM